MARAHISERLRLSNGNAYVDMKEQVPQHIINGVRFIYKQFVKKPGVILNDPPGCDQETQVAIFLEGIRKEVEHHFKYVLIMCHSDKLSSWTNALLKWIPNDLVAIDWPKPTSQKSIYLISSDRLESFCRRQWSIAVVDDDDFLRYKLAHGVFNVQYKIFVTADDLRENLQKFSQIHSWLYPDMKLDLNEFRTDKRSIAAILEKRMWFAEFVRDILIRNNSEISLSLHNEYTVVTKEPAYRKTRKNKDATGTKIKRSKRKIEEDNTDTANRKTVSTAACIIRTSDFVDTVYKGSSTIKGGNDSKLDVSNSNNDTSNMDVETFISSREPLKMDDLHYNSDTDMSHTSENKDGTEVKKSEINVSENENSSSDMNLRYSEELPPNTDDGVYSLETQENVLENNKLETIESEVGDRNTMNLQYSEDSPSITEGFGYSIETQEHLIDNKKLESKESEARSISINAIDKNSLVNTKLDELNCNGTEDAQIANGTKSKLESNVEEKSDVEGNSTKKENTKSNDLDTKWEEMALKKFKGSLLDRIF